MKKQLTPNQTLWIFGSFAFLIFILASYTFLNFWQAFRTNSDVQAPPEAEITSKPTLLRDFVGFEHACRACDRDFGEKHNKFLF